MFFCEYCEIFKAGITLCVRNILMNVLWDKYLLHIPLTKFNISDFKSSFYIVVFTYILLTFCQCNPRLRTNFFTEYLRRLLLKFIRSRSNQLLRKLLENSWRPSKEKNSKVHVKKSATLLNIYFFTSTFKGILPGLKQFMLLFIKTGFINTYNTFKINLYIQEVSSLGYLLFEFAPVQRQENTNSMEIEHEIICFMFRSNFFHKNTVGEKEKRGSAKSDVSEVLFFKNVKITNRVIRRSYGSHFAH